MGTYTDHESKTEGKRREHYSFEKYPPGGKNLKRNGNSQALAHLKP